MQLCGLFPPTTFVFPPTPSPPTIVSPISTPLSATHREDNEEITIDTVAVLSETVALTFTVHSMDPTEYLFDTPVLRDSAGEEIATPLPESLEEARFALLDRITQGQATACLEFPRPEGELPWTLTLVFNPEHEPGDYVAPRVEVEVEVRP